MCLISYLSFRMVISHFKVEWVEALVVEEGDLEEEEVDLGQVVAVEEEEEVVAAEAWEVLMMKTSSLCQLTNVAWLLEKVGLLDTFA